MTRFAFMALNPGTGTIERGALEASSEQAAAEMLAAKGLVVSTLTPDASDRPNNKAAHNPVKGGDLADLFAELKMMLDAGFTLDAAMQAIARGWKAKDASGHIGSLATAIREGRSLKDAFAPLLAHRPDLLALIAASGAHGKLAQAIGFIASRLNDARTRRSQAIEAAIYPTFLMLMVLAALLIIMFVLVPALEPVFAGHTERMPILLQIFAATRRLILDHTLLLTAVAVLGLLTIAILARRGALSSVSARILDTLPLIGPIRTRRGLSLYLDSLGNLLGAGVDIRSALSFTESPGHTSARKAAFDAASDAILAGSSVSKALAKTKAFPERITILLETGDDAHRLPDALKRAAGLLDADAERMARRLMTLLTPIITLAIGGLIGGLVVSVMGAILSINDLAFQ